MSMYPEDDEITDYHIEPKKTTLLTCVPREWRPLCFEQNSNGDCDIYDIPDAYGLDEEQVKEHCTTCAWRKERK